MPRAENENKKTRVSISSEAVQPPSPQECWKYNTGRNLKSEMTCSRSSNTHKKTDIKLCRGINISMKTNRNKMNLLRKTTWISWNKIQMKSMVFNQMEERPSRLLPSGYPFRGLIKLQLPWGRHGLYWGNNEVETKKLLGEKLCNLVLSEIYISRIRE